MILVAWCIMAVIFFQVLMMFTFWCHCPLCISTKTATIPGSKKRDPSQMKCFAVGCFAWWCHFMNHSASMFCFLVQIRVFIVWNLEGIFNYKYERKHEIESGISNSKMTLLCKWPILWEIVRHSKKVYYYGNYSLLLRGVLKQLEAIRWISG